MNLRRNMKLNMKLIMMLNKDMKKNYSKMFFRNFIYLILINSLLYSATVKATDTTYRVTSVVGNCSYVDDKNESHNLTRGVYIPTQAKIVVGVGSQISFTGANEERYFLSENSGLGFQDQKVILYEGTLWVQSSQEEKNIIIETMNGLAKLSKAEVVIDFNQFTKKSQLFVISGHATLSNVFMQDKQELLVSGEISFVQKDFQQGMPRRPTLIGKDSLFAVMKKFKGVSPADDQFKSILDSMGHDSSDRAIASTSLNHEKNGIYFIPKNFSAPKRLYPLRNRQIASMPKNVSPPMNSAQSVTKLQKTKVFIHDFTVSISSNAETSSVNMIKEDTSLTETATLPSERLPSSENNKLNNNRNDNELNGLMNELRKAGPIHNDVY